MKTISVLGCGWLGLPLAELLVKDGYTVRGATTSEGKCRELTVNGISPYLITATPDSIQGPVHHFLTGCAVLVVTIPPGKAGGSYSGTVRKVASAAREAGVDRIIFTSSISVYPNDAQTYTETQNPMSNASAAAELLEAEDIIRKNFPQATILRLGGLVGGDRHPARFVGQKQPAELPQAPINLVHRDDCVEIIRRIIHQDIYGTTFNVVAPYHPTRKQYYSQKARYLNLPAPVFVEDLATSGKIVSSDRIIAVLNYQFSITKEI